MTLRGEHSSFERSATVLDMSIAGIGIECDEALIEGDRLTVAFATPTLWDPLILVGVVAWAHPLREKSEADMLGRPKRSARAGIAFDYPTPDAAFAMFEMLVATAFE